METKYLVLGAAVATGAYLLMPKDEGQALSGGGGLGGVMGGLPGSATGGTEDTGIHLDFPELPALPIMGETKKDTSLGTWLSSDIGKTVTQKYSDVLVGGSGQVTDIPISYRQEAWKSGYDVSSKYMPGTPEYIAQFNQTATKKEQVEKPITSVWDWRLLFGGTLSTPRTTTSKITTSTSPVVETKKTASMKGGSGKISYGKQKVPSWTSQKIRDAISSMGSVRYAKP